MEQKKALRNKQTMTNPPMQKNVLSNQCCPAFVARGGALPCEKECWFCVYADFHLEKACALEVGICGYPVKNKKMKKLAGIGQ